MKAAGKTGQVASSRPASQQCFCFWPIAARCVSLVLTSSDRYFLQLLFSYSVSRLVLGPYMLESARPVLPIKLTEKNTHILPDVSSAR